MPLTKEQFIEDFAAKNGWTVTEFHQRMALTPCACSDAHCKGWKPVLKHRPRLDELSMLPGE
jgi:hypothetical protein